ncbi:MAG: thioredoxin family protein [Bacteroidia bacterium]
MKKISLSLIILLLVSCGMFRSGTQKEFILYGKIKRSQLSEKFPWFETNYNNYKPNDSTLLELNTYSKELKVLVVMGTWCDDSKTNVPAFFKIADKTFMEESQVEIIGVDREKKCTRFDLKKYKIERVPTFILFMKGQQLGSIIENPHESLEKDMLHIVRVIHR